MSNANYYWMRKVFHRTPMFGKILQVLRSIGYCLRIMGGALFLLVTFGPMILAPVYVLYLAILDPWFLLNPQFWLFMIFSIFFAVVAVATLAGRA